MRLRLRDVNYKLEELGITHIKNRDVILRNITNNQDITSLLDLLKICEPLKIYQRNKDGIEYKTFSPFTLFADACTTDAEDALIFNSSVDSFLENQNIDALNNLLKWLKKWSENHKQFLKIEINPKLKPIESLSINLSNSTQVLMNVLTHKKTNQEELNILKESLNTLSQPQVDVEIVIVESLNKLAHFCSQNYVTP
jgi:hexosaminidase